MCSEMLVDKMMELVRLMEKVEGRIDSKDESLYCMSDGKELNYEDPDIDGVVTLCCDLFITDKGQPDRENIRKMREFGYDVARGEGDSFGWLTGYIHRTGSYYDCIFFG